MDIDAGQLGDEPCDGGVGCAVHLLGRFEATVDAAPIDTPPGSRTTELLSYLLVFRDRPHHREVLAGTLWPESSSVQSRKYLRQALWQLRVLLDDGRGGDPLLRTDGDWVQVDETSLWLDIAEMERAFAPVRQLAGEQLTDEQALVLNNVVPLYRGGLAEGCYQDWCIYERERLKAMHIAILEKLLGHCETNAKYQEGLVYGEELLRQERAHERGHWRLMRLRYLAGDRTGALRQFERCREALHDELDVAPGEATRVLYEQIRADAGIRGLRPIVTVEGDLIQRGYSFPGEARKGIAPLEEALEAISRAGSLLVESIQAAQTTL